MSLKALSERVLRNHRDDDTQAELRAVAIEHEADLLLTDPVRGPELADELLQEVFAYGGDKETEAQYLVLILCALRAIHAGKPLVVDIGADFPKLAALAVKTIEERAAAVIDEAKKARPFELPDSDRWLGDVAA
jgi:hypothetical protein